MFLTEELAVFVLKKLQDTNKFVGTLIIPYYSLLV